VEVRVFHSSQLGTDEQMIKGIRVGAPEMAFPSTVMSTVDQRFGVFEMPYLIVNLPSHVDRLIHQLKPDFLGKTVVVVDASPFPRACPGTGGCVDQLAR